MVYVGYDAYVAYVLFMAHEAEYFCGLFESWHELCFLCVESISMSVEKFFLV